MATVLVVKKKGFSLSWELNSIFDCIDHEHRRLVTGFQTKNMQMIELWW